MEGKKSVLIVDDDVFLAGAFQSLLEENGHDVSCCQNGSDAIELANKQKFDVIITDYNMPDMKGDEVCRLLRRDHPDIFIIGCSCDYKDKAFLTAGADTFIIKNQLMLNLVLLMQGSTIH